MVRRWMSGLAGFSNCCRMNELGVSAAISLHFSTAPRMPLAGSACDAIAWVRVRSEWWAGAGEDEEGHCLGETALHTGCEHQMCR